MADSRARSYEEARAWNDAHYPFDGSTPFYNMTDDGYVFMYPDGREADPIAFGARIDPTMTPEQKLQAERDAWTDGETGMLNAAGYGASIGIPNAVSTLDDAYRGWSTSKLPSITTFDQWMNRQYNDARIVDTPLGKMLVGTPNPAQGDWGLGESASGSDFLKQAILGTAGLALGGMGLESLFGGAGAGAGALGGAGEAGALSALESGLGAYTNFGAGAAGAGAGAAGAGLTAADIANFLTTAGGGASEALTPTLGEIISSVGPGSMLPAGGLEAAIGGTGITIPGPLGDLVLDASGNLVGSWSTAGAPTMPTPTAPGTQNPAPVEARDPLTGRTVPTTPDGLPATTTGPTTAASTLSKFLKDNLGINLDPSTISMLGTGIGTLLGAYGSNQQAKSLTDIANQARGDRLPALNAFNTALTNPDSWYQSAPAMGAVDSVLRRLSASVGNPALNPGALSQAAAYNLGGYNDYLRTTGNLGLSGQDSTIRAQTNAAMGDTNFYNAIGSGIGSLTSNQPNVNGLLEQLLKRNNFGLA